MMLRDHAILPVFWACRDDASGVRRKESLIVVKIEPLRIPLGVA